MKETMMLYWHLILTWIVANPAWSMPVIGALVTLILKPRSSAEYASLASKNPTWFFTRWAALLQLVGAVFPDPVKAKRVLFKVIYGTFEPSEAKIPVDIVDMASKLPILIFALALFSGSLSCTKGQAINATVLFAEKVQCALANSDLPNDKLIAKCAIEPGDVERVLAIVGEHRQGVAHAMKTGSCGPDGGK